MSLVKLEGKNIIRQSWLDKKSTKRLKIIRKKLWLNISKINKTYDVLANYGITPTKQLFNILNGFRYTDRQLRKIIIERDKISAKQINYGSKITQR